MDLHHNSGVGIWYSIEPVAAKLDQPYYLYGNKGKPELKWYEVLYNKTIGSEFYQKNCASRLRK